MKCHDCGGTYIGYNDTLDLHIDIIGYYSVDATNYFKCQKCGELLFPRDTVKKIESVEADITNKFISKLPIKEFVFATEAAMLLGITKQAFSKNPRIKNGFIYSVSLGNKKLYHLKSVLLFKGKGDGRFNLSGQQSSKDTRYPVTNQEFRRTPRWKMNSF